MTELEKIGRQSGLKEVSCSCKACAEMCKKTSCLATPTDILRLIEAGFGRYIFRIIWSNGILIDMPSIEMYQIQYSYHKMSCVFLENDLCLLHDSGLKPVEGKLAIHTDQVIKKGQFPVWAFVAATWMHKDNLETIRQIVTLMKPIEAARKPEDIPEVPFRASMLDAEREKQLLNIIRDSLGLQTFKIPFE